MVRVVSRARVAPLLFLFAALSCQQACPSVPGGPCDPRNANCPKGYACALAAEICTRTCEQTSDCWVRVEDGCRYTELPGMRLPDGGVFTDQTSDGFCPESKRLECTNGYCQFAECSPDGCDYDIYGPSAFKGNRSQGPNE